MKSQRIALFLPLPEHGHILPTLKLARRFQGDGWRVFHVAEEKFAPLLSRHGIHCIETPTFGGAHPELGSIDPKKLTRAERRKFDKSWDHTWIHRAAKDLVRKLNPSAVLIDSFRSDFCCIPVAEGVPTVTYHLCRDAERFSAPPLVRGYGRPRDPISWARMRIDWLCIWSLRRLLNRSRSMRERLLGAREIFRQRGLQIRPNSMSPFGYDVNTAVMGPAALSMGSLPADRYFGYGLRGDAAGEEPADFPQFSTERPVVYCSFGSMSARHGEAYSIFNDLIEVFAAQGKFNLIVQAGKFADDLSDRGAGNVRVVNFAPQLAYLKRASVAITHGGYGTVKECVANEVPMLVVPFLVDQFGNARLVQDLGVGASLGRKRFDARKAHLLVESLAADPQARVRLRALYSREQDDAEFERAYASLLARIGATAGEPARA